MGKGFSLKTELELMERARIGAGGAKRPFAKKGSSQDHSTRPKTRALKAAIAKDKKKHPERYKRKKKGK